MFARLGAFWCAIGALLAPIALAVVVREALAEPRPRGVLVFELGAAAGLASLLVLPFAVPLLVELLAGGLRALRDVIGLRETEREMVE